MRASEMNWLCCPVWLPRNLWQSGTEPKSIAFHSRPVWIQPGTAKPEHFLWMGYPQQKYYEWNFRRSPSFSQNCYVSLLQQASRSSLHRFSSSRCGCSSVWRWPPEFVRQQRSWATNTLLFSFPHLGELWSVLEKSINNLRGNFKFRCYPQWGEQN